MNDYYLISKTECMDELKYSKFIPQLLKRGSKID